MTNVSSVAIFFLLLIMFAVGVPVILDLLTEDYIGSYSFAYESLSDNDTLVNCSGNHTFTPVDRISEVYNGSVWITYLGGNESDLVYVNGYYIGNLTLPSPDNISVNALYLSTNTTVTYVPLVANATNITGANLTWYSWSGCNYGESSCQGLKVIRDSSRDIWYFVGQLPLLVGAFLIFVGAVWLVKR
jgi:hypothetical protein